MKNKTELAADEEEGILKRIILWPWGAILPVLIAASCYVAISAYLDARTLVFPPTSAPKLIDSIAVVPFTLGLVFLLAMVLIAYVRHRSGDRKSARNLLICFVPSAIFLAIAFGLAPELWMFFSLIEGQMDCVPSPCPSD